METLRKLWHLIRDNPIVFAIGLMVVASFSAGTGVVYALVLLFGLIAWIGYRHPFWAIPVFVAIMLIVQEFYPFSNFPMYGDPDESENYFYVAEVVDPKTDPPTLKALPIETLTRTTAPKVKKMFKSRRDARADELGIDDKEMTKEQLAQVGHELIAYLRGREGRTDATLPKSLALVEVWIIYDGAHGFSETPEIVVYDPPLQSLSTPP